MKEIIVKDGKILDAKASDDLVGVDKYVDKESYMMACQSIQKQDLLIDTLLQAIKELAKTSDDEGLRQLCFDLMMRVTKIRG